MSEAFKPPIDYVNQPPHYKQGEVECIDAIKSALSESEFRGFLKGQVIKYVWRERNKCKEEDLAKAQFYMKLLNGEDPRK